MRDRLCAVDVGTGSVRAGIFTGDGELLARASTPIAIDRPGPARAEHDSSDIWAAVCKSVAAAMAKSGSQATQVAAIAFDATCSLVIRGEGGVPLPVSPDRPSRWDTICWMDHRATAEAEECTATGHRVLDFIGGVMSPEMQLPKLMWLKRFNGETWRKMALAFDLADFLTWKATGLAARSQCTVTAKWTYLAHDSGWQEDFFDDVGLGDLGAKAGLPATAVEPGAAIGPLCAEAAQALTLDTGCMVATGLIDAFAGALGVIGGHAGPTVDRHLALIAGTSSCVMGLAPDPRPAGGLWGPYYGAAMPGYWLSEGGQSATGALLDHVISAFGGGLEPGTETHQRIVTHITELLAEEGDNLAGDLHVLPDFHGNRTPFADANAAGVLSGLALDSSFDGLCKLYWRTSVSIALGVRHILDHMNAHGYRIDTLHLTGGHTRNPLLTGLYADATGCRLVLPETEDAVLLGSAMNAASAAGIHKDLQRACLAMTGASRTVEPDPARRARFENDYRIFKRLHEQRREILAMGREVALERRGRPS